MFVHFWEKHDISKVVCACHKIYFQMWRYVRFDFWWPWAVKSNMATIPSGLHLPSSCQMYLASLDPRPMPDSNSWPSPGSKCVWGAAWALSVLKECSPEFDTSAWRAVSWHRSLPCRGGSWGLGALGPAILWGPSAMVRPNVCQLGRWKPPAGCGAEPRRQTHFGNNILKIGWKSDILAAVYTHNKSDLISDVVSYGKSRYPSRLYEMCHQETTVI